MNMSRAEIEKHIKEMERDIKNEPKYSQRWIFLAVTINHYRDKIGKPELKKYTW